MPQVEWCVGGSCGAISLSLPKTSSPSVHQGLVRRCCDDLLADGPRVTPDRGRRRGGRVPVQFPIQQLGWQGVQRGPQLLTRLPKHLAHGRTRGRRQPIRRDLRCHRLQVEQIRHETQLIPRPMELILERAAESPIGGGAERVRGTHPPTRIVGAAPSPTASGPMNGASAINCYSGGQKLVPGRGSRQPARHGARDRADAD